jgi:hypothetical protein
MINNDLNVYVLQHKPYFNKHNDLENRVPLQVGAWDKQKFCDVCDCYGDNISNKNKVYLETTGHYWVLKNDNHSEYVGIEHCCRQFLEFDTEEKIKSVLQEYDIILPQKAFGDHTIEKTYALCHIHNDLLVCKDIIYDMNYNLGKMFDDYVSNDTSFYWSNIFITRWDIFEHAWNFVFDVLSEYEKRMGFNRIGDWRRYVQQNEVNHDHFKVRHPKLSWVDYQMRIGGSLSERLFSFYVTHSNLKIYESTVQAEWYDDNLSIYVFTHKRPKFKLIEDDIHTQIQVGADCTKEDILDVKDNTFDNISSKNPLYSELTGLYWVWKNSQLTEYIGCEHYRRHFNISEKEIKEKLNEFEIILPKKCVLTNEESHESFYEKFHNIKDLHLCRDVLYELYPDYKDSYEKYIANDNKIYIANSFITKKDNFEKICEFIFNILFEVENRLGFKTMDEWREYVTKNASKNCPKEHLSNGASWQDYQLRIPAFIAERLLTLYVLHNFNNKICEIDLVRIDK